MSRKLVILQGNAKQRRKQLRALRRDYKYLEPYSWYPNGYYVYG